MSLARQHKAHHAALRAATATSNVVGGLASLVPAHRASAHPLDLAQSGPGALALARLTHDMRRLKDIESVERKIAAKREMLPEYADYIAGLLSAAAASGHGAQDEVLPTIMVWHIDTGNYALGLELARYVIGHKLEMPARFKRSAPCLVTEQIAEAAIIASCQGQAFNLDVLRDLDELVADEDMPDEVRAKLSKAIGLELSRRCGDPDAENAIAGGRRATINGAIAALKRALELDSRAGVKKMIERLETEARKLDAPAPNTPQGEASAQTESPPIPKARKRGGTKPPAQAG